MSPVKAPANLHELVRRAFAKALAAGELHYFPAQVAVLPINSIPFQLRFSPSLANKPKGPPPPSSDPSQHQQQQQQPRKPFDPFANPPPSLFISDLGPSHFLVLNKFAVVPEHFILATREYKPQTHVLEESDLEATLACIDAYERARGGILTGGVLDDGAGGGSCSSSREETSTAGRASQADGLFAFFNSGEHSGASQPHRHIQLLPVSRMKDGLDDATSNSSSSNNSGPWDVLAANPDSLQRTPFVAFSEPISAGMSSADLHAAYLRLYRHACCAVSQHTRNPSSSSTPASSSSPPSGQDIPSVGEANISYNMAMTRDTLVVCPRLAEGAAIASREQRGAAQVLGSLSLNGTLLAGTALVKSEAEWEALRRDPGGLLDVLKVIGVPREGLGEGFNKL